MSDNDPLGVRELQRALADADMEVAMERAVMEASQIGWAPGEWPDNFMHDGARFFRERDVLNDGELVAVVYRGTDGRYIEVLND